MIQGWIAIVSSATRYPKETAMRVESPPNKVEPLEEDETFSSIEEYKKQQREGYSGSDAVAQPRLSCPCLPNSVRLTFTSQKLEDIYQRNNQRERLRSVMFFTIFAILVNTVLLILLAIYGLSGKSRKVLGVYGTFIVVFICLFFASRQRCSTKCNIPSLIWLSAALELLLLLGLREDPLTPSDSVGCVTFLAFLAFILLPMRLRFCLLWVSALVVAHCFIVRFKSKKFEDYLGRQVSVLQLPAVDLSV